MISRSSTPFPPKLLTSHTASANAASARTNIGISHDDSNTFNIGNVTVVNVSSGTENQTISHNMCFFRMIKIRFCKLTKKSLIYMIIFEIFKNNKNNSVLTGVSNLIFFDPRNSKENKKLFLIYTVICSLKLSRRFGKVKKCDCWPIVCIFFELVLGFLPFHAKTSEQIFERIFTCDLQYPKFNLVEEEREIFPLQKKK